MPRLEGRVRRAALRPRHCEVGLQGHQRELAPQLGTRRREKLLPNPMVLGECTLEHSWPAGVLLQLGERRGPQPLYVGRLETEEKPRLIAAVAARVPRGEQDRQAQIVLRLVEIRGVVGASGPGPRPETHAK